jgi:hypothetical protein
MQHGYKSLCVNNLQPFLFLTHAKCTGTLIGTRNSTSELPLTTADHIWTDVLMRSLVMNLEKTGDEKERTEVQVVDG